MDGLENKELIENNLSLTMFSIRYMIHIIFRQKIKIHSNKMVQVFVMHAIMKKKKQIRQDGKNKCIAIMS